MSLVVAVALAGGAGAVCRFVLDSALRRRSEYPIGTLVINVSGSLLLGLLAGLVSAGLVGDGGAEVAGAGFLGGYTTFSTAAVEAVRLAEERRTRSAVVASIGMLAAGVAAAALGLALGGLLAR